MSWQQLRQLHAQQKVPHAILLSGRNEAELLALAARFEQLLLCHAPTSEGACGSCRQCYLFKQQHHPDSRHLGEEDAISIDDIREVSHFLAQTSHQQGYKVVTLIAADRLAVAPANALLKTLEEPHDKTVLILTATVPSQLLATLKSRCFHLPLTQQPVVDPAFNEQDNQKWRMLLSNALVVDSANTLENADIQQLITAMPTQALYLLYNWLSDFIRYVLHARSGCLSTEDEKNMQRLAHRVSVKQAFLFLEKISETIQILSSPGINKQLLFESLFYHWQIVTR